MAYTFKYRIAEAPVASQDGSGVVAHRLQIAYQINGGDWLLVPGRERTVNVPTARLKTVMDLPHSNASEKSAKVSAYKTAIAENLETPAVPLPDRWTRDAIVALLDANIAAATEAARAVAFITTTLALTFPVDFAM